MTAEPSRTRWAELKEGHGPAPIQMAPLSLTDFVRYQGASGDMNPIHHDIEFARASGFPSPISVGMFQAGALHAFAASWLGPENVRRVTMRWHQPVFAGDTLTLSAVIVKKHDDAGERQVEVAVDATNQDGSVVVSGTATYVVP